MVQIVDPKHEWAIEIGRIVIAFGSIEHVTMVCLRNLPADPIYDVTSHLNLGPRLDLLIAILKSSTDRSATPLLQLFEAAKKLAEDRNAVVHNPLMLNVFEDGTGGYDFRHAIQLLRKDRQISFDDLVNIRTKSERLATDLYATATPLLARRRESGLRAEGPDA